MEYQENKPIPKRSVAPPHETSSRAAGDRGMYLEDNRPMETIQQKSKDITENKNIDVPIQKKENNTGLPDTLKSGIENLSGYAMDDVKVHYNSDKPTQLNAHAYAQGTDIHLASGQEKHLAHEAWHVVQQKQGRVQPTKQLKSKVHINDDDGLEKEADVMGAKALQLQSKDRTSTLQTVTISKRIAQRYIVPDDEIAGSFTSQVSRDKDGGGKTFLNDAGDAATLETKDTSKVRVAVTGKMAVEDSDKSARQAKFFYADGDILKQANTAMKLIKSPISFKTGDNTIKVQDSNGIEHTLNLIIPIQNEGKESEKEGTDIRIPENCNEAACTITNMGGGGQNRFEGKFKSDGDAISAPSGVVGQDLIARMGAFLPAYLKVKEYEASSSISKFFSNEPTVEKELLNVTRDTSLKSRDKITGYKDGINSSKLEARMGDMQDRIGGYYSNEFLNKSGSKEIIDQLGINESAAPDAGDAMAIFSIGKTIGDVDGDFSVKDYRTGNLINKPAPYHFATVIARSGADYITMENYVRRNEEADTHSPATLDPRYFFRMYGPEAQSFHSENVDRFPNAMTLALSKPVQQVAQLQSDAPIQFNDEEDAVENVREKMPEGPGNLLDSSDEAKERFDLATQLENLLLITKNSTDGETGENRGLDGLGGDALYRKDSMYGDKKMSVSSHVSFTSGGKERKKQLEKAKELKNLTEIVWRDFVLKKTGGGSCDHISAATFLNLVEKDKEPILVSYKPKSDKDYHIAPPPENPENKHRSVLVSDENEDKKPILKEVDSWIPDEGRVRIFESEKEADKQLEGVKVLRKWKLDDKEFVEAVQIELEARYKELEKDEKLKGLSGDSKKIKLLWNIMSRKKETEEK